MKISHKQIQQKPATLLKNYSS
jgi:uncharacterized membrane protein